MLYCRGPAKVYYHPYSFVKHLLFNRRRPDLIRTPPAQYRAVRLLFALKGVIAQLTGADLDHLLHIVDEELAVAHMAGIEGLAGCQAGSYRFVEYGEFI